MQLELKIPPPVVAATIAAGMVSVALWVGPVLNLPMALRLGGALALAAMGGCFDLAGIWVFRKAKTTVAGRWTFDAWGQGEGPRGPKGRGRTEAPGRAVRAIVAEQNLVLVRVGSMAAFEEIARAAAEEEIPLKDAAIRDGGGTFVVPLRQPAGGWNKFTDKGPPTAISSPATCSSSTPAPAAECACSTSDWPS